MYFNLVLPSAFSGQSRPRFLRLFPFRGPDGFGVAAQGWAGPVGIVGKIPVVREDTGGDGQQGDVHQNARKGFHEIIFSMGNAICQERHRSWHDALPSLVQPLRFSFSIYWNITTPQNLRVQYARILEGFCNDGRKTSGFSTRTGTAREKLNLVLKQIEMLKQTNIPARGHQGQPHFTSDNAGWPRRSGTEAGQQIKN